MKFIVAAIILITIIRVEKADFEKFYTRKNINSVKKFATLAIITTIVEFSAFHTALANEGFFSSSSFNQYFSIRWYNSETSLFNDNFFVRFQKFTGHFDNGQFHMPKMNVSHEPVIWLSIPFGSYRWDIFFSEARSDW